jgi:hypothetical protein
MSKFWGVVQNKLQINIINTLKLQTNATTQK